MKLAKVFLEAFRAMAMNRLRAGLTMPGIIIGVGAVVLMPVIGESVRDLASIAAAAQGIATALTLLFGAIGSISLLAGGGIGSMNIRLLSVTERTREFGIRMPLGAKRRDELLQFLTKANFICGCGCAIGVAVAYGGSVLITEFSPMEVGICATGIAIAFSFSALIGIFFGFYPAQRAAGLRPVEALRYE